MKKAVALLVCLCVLLSSVGVLAEPRADAVFTSASITLSGSGNCTYRAATNTDADRIEITAVYLFKKVNGVWECAGSLPIPSYVATNTSTYSATINYYAYMGTGTYRVQAMFNADGHEAYRYSNGVDF